jgi:hypothetical protein
MRNMGRTFPDRPSPPEPENPDPQLRQQANGQRWVSSVRRRSPELSLTETFAVERRYAQPSCPGETFRCPSRQCPFLDNSCRPELCRRAIGHWRNVHLGAASRFDPALATLVPGLAGQFMAIAVCEPAEPSPSMTAGPRPGILAPIESWMGRRARTTWSEERRSRHFPRCTCRTDPLRRRTQ